MFYLIDISLSVSCVKDLVHSRTDRACGGVTDHLIYRPVCHNIAAFLTYRLQSLVVAMGTLPAVVDDGNGAILMLDVYHHKVKVTDCTDFRVEGISGDVDFFG